MSVAVVSPASSAATLRQTRATASSAAQAYATLQQGSPQQTGPMSRHRRHHAGKRPASPSGTAAQTSGAKPIGDALNILA